MQNRLTIRCYQCLQLSSLRVLDQASSRTSEYKNMIFFQAIVDTLPWTVRTRFTCYRKRVSVTRICMIRVKIIHTNDLHEENFSKSRHWLRWKIQFVLKTPVRTKVRGTNYMCKNSYDRNPWRLIYWSSSSRVRRKRLSNSPALFT